ncbi:MAG TPA: tetratricopeptide repeat protein [Terriglobales bacterium]|nr:tetratricopeptide repeat protein [Terriglobales bacterium]
MQRKTRFLELALAVLFLAAPVAAQLTPSDPTTFTDLKVRVTYANDREVSMGLRVELVTSNELSVSQGFTDDTGQAIFSRIRPGYYRLRVSGVGIEDVTTNNFLISRGEGTHFEFVRVEAKDSAGVVALGSGPPVSAVELNVPDGARKEYDAGMTALNLKNWPEAKVRFEKALAIYPQYARASNGLGVAFMNTGAPARGRQAFEAALRLDDHLPDAAQNLGLIAYNEKRYREAEDLLNKSLAGDPMNPDTLLHLANTQLLLGKLEESVATARRVHNLEHSQFTLVHLIAARALEALKRPAEAAEYQLYLQESPTGSAAESARAGLQALQTQIPH